MSARTLKDSRRWVDEGTELVFRSISVMDDGQFDRATELPGWTRKHLVAHLALNAQAIGNLMTWAGTGQVTPMYTSKEQREADIQEGARLGASELVEQFDRTARVLREQMDDLSPEQWTTQVLTAQGRTVPATEAPWMRAREVMVHSVDLGSGIGFAELPRDFLVALCDDIVATRGTAARAGDAGPALMVEAADAPLRWRVDGDGATTTVVGTLADLAGYLSGRTSSGVATVDGEQPPELPAWL